MIAHVFSFDNCNAKQLIEINLTLLYMCVDRSTGQLVAGVKSKLKSAYEARTGRSYKWLQLGSFRAKSGLNGCWPSDIMNRYNITVTFSAG